MFAIIIVLLLIVICLQLRDIALVCDPKHHHNKHHHDTNHGGGCSCPECKKKNEEYGSIYSVEDYKLRDYFL